MRVVVREVGEVRNELRELHRNVLTQNDQGS
jgi:hypothetical protein